VAPKAKATSKPKDVKEKRDVVTPTPYSYEVPQKSFQSPIHVQHSQPKYTTIVEQQSAPQKVAPLEYPKEDAAQAINEPSSEYHPTTFHQQSFGPDFEALYTQSLKNYDDTYGQSYQHFDSFNQVPVVHYNGEYDKINSAIVAIPGYAVKAAPVVSNIKAIPSYVYASPASSYNYPSYSYPSQSYVHSYPQAVAASSPHQHYATHGYAHSPSSQHFASHGFSQSPSAIFIPQTISISSKVPSKVPDYATGSKGLGHYSTVAAAPIASLHSGNSYVSHYSHSHPQTERPFKASPYLGSSHPSDSYTEQSIGPSKTYLPAKEHTYTVHQHVPQVEYQIQYVQQQPSKSYLPAKEQHYAAPVSNSYLPPHKVVVESPKNSYLPPAAAPTKTYLPAKAEAPSHVYLPSKVEKPTNVYLPSKVEKPSSSYLPPNNPYAHTQSAISHQQYQSHSAPVHQQYQTHSAPAHHQQYQSQAAPAHHQQYQTHAAPAHQQYQSLSASHEYESAEYQTVAAHSGHK
jgi:hypothetical protein